VTPQQSLDRHFSNIEKTALADLKTLVDHGGGMGVFFLGTPIIDALAAAYTRQQGHYWKKYTHAFMPNLEPLADVLYEEFRSPGAHNLSASARFLFTSGDDNRNFHMREANGRWVLHAGAFAHDVTAGFNQFWARARAEPELCHRVLTWFDAHTPIGPLPSDARAALGTYTGATGASATGGRIGIADPQG
jgi:hypothetical protein